MLGTDPRDGGRELRDRVGIVLQSSGIENELYVGEALELYGSCYRRRRDVDEVLELVGLAELAGQRIGTLSGGQRRRIDLALGIVGHPELLFLDEPTTGFDPAARRRSWELISDLCGEGTTVLLTTHYLEEAEHLADRVGVLKAGRLIAEGAPSELIRAETETRVSFHLPDGITIDELVAVIPSAASIVGTTGRVLDQDADGRGRRAHRLGRGTRTRVGGAVGDATDTRGRVLGSRRRRPTNDRLRRRGGAMNEWPSTVGLVVRQIRYQILMFRRVPIALFFTLLLPLIMLVLFNALFGDGEVTVDGTTWPTRQFYTGGLAAFTAVSATYTNLANMVPIRREEGVLKRWRGPRCRRGST